ncbi:glucose 1-dehydrogenase [soil metagenome]
MATDVTDEGDVARLVAEAVRRYGQLDVAFNNAGTGGVAGPIETIDLAAFSQVLAVNVVGTFLSLKHQIPALRDGGGGSIINNASTTGVVGSRSGMAAYTAAKHGVCGLTRAAALEHGASNIRVNALVTGPVATDQLESWFEAQPERAERIIGATALGRPAEESEIAALVVFLATKGAGYITGAALAIDGGLTAG